MINIKYSTKYFPKSAVIEITNICNLRCNHCYIDKSEPYFLDNKTCLNLIDQLSKLGCFKLVVSGGEVFLHKEVLFELVKKAKEMEFDVTIITNFILCTYDDIRLLNSLGLNSLNVSLYGRNEESYLNFTGCKQDVSELKKKVLFARKIGIKVSVLSAGINSLYFDLLDIQKWCHENDIPFNIAYVIYGKEKGIQLEEPLSNDKMKSLLMGDKRVSSLPKGKENERRSALDFCAAGAHNICIAANGNVYPCANWRVKVGSIFNNTLLDIWNNSTELTKIRQMRFVDFECSKCDKFDICPVCPGINYSATGDAQKPSSELCRYTSVVHQCALFE